MTSRYWLAVTKADMKAFLSQCPPWWCLPSRASFGNKVLVYRARTTSGQPSGVFGDFEVVKHCPTASDTTKCQGLRGPNGSEALVYSELKLISEFPNPVSSKEMRADLELSRAQFIRRNFQGTVFELLHGEYRRIQVLAGPKS